MTTEQIIERTKTKLPEIDTRFVKFTGKSIKVGFFEEGIDLPSDAAARYKLLKFAEWQMSEQMQWVFKGVAKK